jgi:alanine racemase
MSRMGVPYHRALPWLEGLARTDLTVDGTFMGFTEEADFDREQLRRFQGVVERARAGGIALGALHAASSNGVFHLPEAHLDMVRPGIALFGAYPSDWQRERAMAELRPAVRLRARVVRVEQLRAGDGVSYGHNYVADRPTWVATLPVGHTDGVPREAVEGAKVLIGGRLYPIIGAVSASHSIVEVGDEERVRIGDEATLLGPDHPELAPNAVAAATGRSVYDVLMHLNPDLPRLVLGVD